jgi:hypothetical protein
MDLTNSPAGKPVRLLLDKSLAMRIKLKPPLVLGSSVSLTTFATVPCRKIDLLVDS